MVVLYGGKSGVIGRLFHMFNGRASQWKFDRYFWRRIHVYMLKNFMNEVFVSMVSDDILH